MLARIPLSSATILLLLAGACAPEARPRIDEASELLSRTWEHKLISSGDNFPTVNLRREHRADLALLLHEGVRLDKVAASFEWSSDDLQVRLDELDRAGLVRRDGERYVPTFMVMSAAGVDRHMPVSGQTVDEAVSLIERLIPRIRRLYDMAPGLARVPFEASALLILSDVILDNWQINEVEGRYLRAERPLRDGKRYYFALQEDDPADSTEAFGIYGNQYRGFGPYTVGVYGNRRTNNPLNFATIGAQDLLHLFGTEPDTVAVFKQELLHHLVAASGTSASTMPGPYRDGFASIGWMDGDRVLVPILGPAERTILDEIAALMTDDLILLLERHRTDLVAAYQESPYAREVTFEEYFIWWYHLFYTAVTDRLAERGYLTVPTSGITSYVLVSES